MSCHQILSTVARSGAATLLLLAGTACAIRAELPEQFLQVEDSSTSFKATTAEDAIFFVERFAVPEHGEKLEFWVDAVQNDFVENRGYTLLASEPTSTRAGDEGRQLLFEVTTQGQTFRYLVALFVRQGLLFGPRVYAARFTAPKAVFSKHLEQVKTAIESLRF